MQLLGFEKDSSDYCKNYLNFADNMFWSALEKILLDELSDLVPHYIKVFCGQLLHHEEPAYVKGSECRIVSDDPQFRAYASLPAHRPQYLQFFAKWHLLLHLMFSSITGNADIICYCSLF